MASHEKTPDIIARRILADASGVAPEQVPDDASINNWYPWDSLAHMRVVAAMEDYLGRELPLDVIVEIENLDDISGRLGVETAAR